MISRRDVLRYGGAWFQGLNSVLGAWQTKAWSNGLRATGAVLFQREVVTAVDPGAPIGGGSVDVDVLATDFGQWDGIR